MVLPWLKSVAGIPWWSAANALNFTVTVVKFLWFRLCSLHIWLVSGSQTCLLSRYRFLMVLRQGWGRKLCIRPGDTIVPDSPLFDSQWKISSQKLHNCHGVLMVKELAEALSGQNWEWTPGFNIQEEVGLRGAHTSCQSVLIQSFPSCWSSPQDVYSIKAR